VKGEKDMKASVNVSECSGCGLCADICGEVFEIDPVKEISKIKEQPDGPGQESRCQEAADACPMESISIE
jgi:ferredoxin